MIGRTAATAAAFRETAEPATLWGPAEVYSMPVTPGRATLRRQNRPQFHQPRPEALLRSKSLEGRSWARRLLDSPTPRPTVRSHHVALFASDFSRQRVLWRFLESSFEAASRRPRTLIRGSVGWRRLLNTERAAQRRLGSYHSSRSMSPRSARRAFRDAWKPTAISKAAPTNFSTCAKSSSVRRRAASFAR